MCYNAGYINEPVDSPKKTIKTTNTTLVVDEKMFSFCENCPVEKACENFLLLVDPVVSRWGPTMGKDPPPLCFSNAIFVCRTLGPCDLHLQCWSLLFFCLHYRLWCSLFFLVFSLFSSCFWCYVRFSNVAYFLTISACTDYRRGHLWGANYAIDNCIVVVHFRSL